jgi:hypothetical protein
MIATKPRVTEHDAVERKTVGSVDSRRPKPTRVLRAVVMLLLQRLGV